MAEKKTPLRQPEDTTKPPKRRVGRPRHLTPERKERFLSSLAYVADLGVACRYAGLEPPTVWGWLRLVERDIKEGRTPPQEYFEFFNEFHATLAETETVLAQRLAVHPDPKHAVQLLSRRFPERWSESRRVQVEIEKFAEKQLAQLERLLPPEQFETVLSVLVGDPAEATSDEE